MPTGPREIKAYVGPFPPSGTHDYKFTLYALAADKLDLSKITTEPVVSNALYWRYGRAATCAAGEPFKFGIDSTPPTRERLSELLQSCGLALRKQRTLGRETEKERAWGGFAVASAE